MSKAPRQQAIRTAKIQGSTNWEKHLFYIIRKVGDLRLGAEAAAADIGNDLEADTDQGELANTCTLFHGTLSSRPLYESPDPARTPRSTQILSPFFSLYRLDLMLTQILFHELI